MGSALRSHAMLEKLAALAVVLVVAAVLVLLAWRLLRLRMTEVRGRQQPKDYLSEQDIEELLTEDRPENKDDR